MVRRAASSLLGKAVLEVVERDGFSRVCAEESEPACESARGAIFGYGVETTRSDLLWEDQRGTEVSWGRELDAVGDGGERRVDGTWSRLVRLFARRCYYWRSLVVINETWTHRRRCI